MSETAFLVAGTRTPIGRFGGGLSRIPVEGLFKHVVDSVIRKTGIHPEDIDGGVCAHAFQSRFAPNTGRFSWIKAGHPASVPWETIEVECGSGMRAAGLAANEITLGHGDLYMAVGLESMSTIPYIISGDMRFSGLLSRWFTRGQRPHFGWADDGLWPRSLAFDLNTTYMAGVAQRLADTYNVSRTEADEYALLSQNRALAAIKSGRFAREIEPILGKRGFVSRDEHPRESSLEALAKLPGVLKTQDITAGNSSGINDGACALLITSGSKANQLGLSPLVEIVDQVLVGVDPKEMGIGPVVSINKLLKRNDLKVKDIDLFEVNEAFSAQYLACEKLLGLPRVRTNVNGGAIALGHPIAMSGARVAQTLSYEMCIRQAQLGVGSLCIGGGLGIATLYRLVKGAKPVF